jgi:serine protease Do
VKRFPDWLFYLLVLGAMWLAFGGAEEDAQQDAALDESGALVEDGASVPQGGAPLPAPSVFDSVSEAVAEPVLPGSTGTAFAVGPGVWLTARHVVRGCPLVGLTDAPMQMRVRAELAFVSERADVAVLRTRGGPQPLALDLEEADLTLGTPGFHIGYPQGRPGEVESRLLGRERLVTSGAWRGRENTLAWAEAGRSRGLDGSLGGLSGGPVLDEEGRVLGITIAESPRRGRVITTAADSLIRDLSAARVPVAGEPVTGLDADTNWTPAARQLRADQQVLRVICFSG